MSVNAPVQLSKLPCRMVCELHFPGRERGRGGEYEGSTVIALATCCTCFSTLCLQRPRAHVHAFGNGGRGGEGREVERERERELVEGKERVRDVW